MERLLREISAVFPANCLDGDEGALKRAIKLERSR